MECSLKNCESFYCMPITYYHITGNYTSIKNEI